MSLSIRIAAGLALLLTLALAGCRPAPTSPAPPPPRETATPAPVLPRPTPVPRRANPPAPLVICLDPGHPSETSPGNARLLNGLREVEVVYDIALALQPVLERDLGATVVLTREFRTASEGKVTNRKRAEIANAAHADLFLRLHCDAGPSASSGFAVYYPDCPGTVAGVTGPTADVRTRSERAAYAFHAGMADDLASALPNNGVKGDSATAVGARQGALTGSIFARVPTITVEMAFLTNPDDARFIASPDGQVRMVRALAAGVRRALGR